MNKILILQNSIEYDLLLFRKYGKVFSYFEGNSPNLYVADTEWIRAIAIKDFDHFVNRRVTTIPRRNREDEINFNHFIRTLD